MLTKLFPVLVGGKCPHTHVYYDLGCTVGCYSPEATRSDANVQFSTLSSLTHGMQSIKSYLKPNDLSTSKVMVEIFPVIVNRDIFKTLMHKIQLCDTHIHTSSLLFHNSLTSRSLYNLFLNSESLNIATGCVWDYVCATETQTIYLAMVMSRENEKCNIDTNNADVINDEEYDMPTRKRLDKIYKKYNASIPTNTNPCYRLLFVYMEILLRHRTDEVFIQPDNKKRFRLESAYTSWLSPHQKSVANLIFNIVWSQSLTEYALGKGDDYMSCTEGVHPPPETSNYVPKFEDIEHIWESPDECNILADRLNSHVSYVTSDTESHDFDSITSCSSLPSSVCSRTSDDPEEQPGSIDDVTSDTHLEQVTFNFSHSSKYLKLFFTDFGNIHSGNARIPVTECTESYSNPEEDEVISGDSNPGYQLQHPDGANILGVQVYNDPLKEYEGKNYFDNWDSLYMLPTYMTSILHDVGISPIYKNDASSNLKQLLGYIQYICHDFINNLKRCGRVNTRVEYFMKFSSCEGKSLMTTSINLEKLCRITRHDELIAFVENKIELYVKPIYHFIHSISQSSPADTPMSEKFLLSPESKTYLLFCSDVIVHQFGSEYQSSMILKTLQREIQEAGHIHLPALYRVPLGEEEMKRTHLCFGEKSCLSNIDINFDMDQPENRYLSKKMPLHLSSFRDVMSKHMKKMFQASNIR